MHRLADQGGAEAEAFRVERPEDAVLDGHVKEDHGLADVEAGHGGGELGLELATDDGGGLQDGAPAGGQANQLLEDEAQQAGR